MEMPHEKAALYSQASAAPPQNTAPDTTTALQSGVSVSNAYAQVPYDLKELNQWVCWRSVDRGGVKRTKVPLNPNTESAASVTNSADWVSFQVASSAVGYDGIGFVFTNDDPYAFIDLDDTLGDAEAYARQVRIVEAFDSYSELSPSGRGVHVIVKASLPHGRRRDDVELYSDQRYATVTGNVIHNAPIAERQALATTLFDELGGAKASTAGIQTDRAATQDDATVVAVLCADPARAAGYNGNTGGDHSAADASLVNALARISGNREQVERIWLASPLGQREKTQKRRDYRQRTIEWAFNETPLPNVGNGFTINGQAFNAPPVAEPLIIDAGTLHGQRPPMREYVIDGWFLAGQATLLSGSGGAGKSLATQQACAAVALGVPFLGQATTKSVTLYLTCEDDIAELHRRLVPICTTLGVSMQELTGQMGLVSLAGHLGNELVTFDRTGMMTVRPGYAWLERTIKAMKAKFVVLDNVAHLFTGDENNRYQVAAFINLLNGLASDTGAAIVLIGHPNKSGDGYSGSTAWENQVRSRLFLEIPNNNGFVTDLDARILTRAKANYGRAGEVIEFRWHQGAFTREEDLQADVASKIKENAKVRLHDEAFLACLASATANRRAISHNPGANYFGKIFPSMQEAAGLKRQSFEQAFERLLHRHRIQIDQQLWQRDNRVWKFGIKLAENCTTPPAPTSCTDPHQPPGQVLDITSTAPHAPTPLYTTYIDSGALGALHHSSGSSGEPPPNT